MATGQGLFAASSFGNVGNSLDLVADKRVPAFIRLGQLNADLGDVRIAQSGYIGAPADMQSAFKQDMEKAMTKVETGISTYQSLLVDAADKELFEKVATNWKEMQSEWRQIVTLLGQSKQQDANALFFGKALEVYNKTGDNIQAAVDDMAGDTKKESAEALEATEFGKFSAYVALGASLVVALGCMALSVFHISRPLTRIIHAMRKLTEGDLNVGIPGAARKDEIGDMADALEIFKRAAISNKQLEDEALENRKQAEASRLAAQQTAEAEAAERLRAATSGLAEGLKKLASGDLSIQLTQAFSSEFEPLRHDFNQSVQQLSSAMSAIMRSVATMESGAQEIAASVDDLSRRTEQQAASLEETAAAVEEITANVQNSTKRTNEAKQVTTQANVSAGESANVVSQAEDAMQRIEGASQQISNIISVIDEIAFQTNLLALNAGVEAARAGEAGKGFAVVAQEVRELAQRSAKAAKEIKELIQNSSSEVDSGVTLVRGAGNALKTIGDFIADINQHMESITQSAKEQSVGLSEVNQSVNSMDQMTQKNAAMVEECNATANTLAQEAVRLRGLLSQFRIERNASDRGASGSWTRAA
ncbi:methyl-accepting chemotaxis protein [Rhizobium oryzicola]|uniref:Methyl-accepting chemotaxis protein n=2 Tax=Rhizobium oryzicola TaxID=1232668 RepID=A0ABT8STP1_9HYPH|nr:methyl-accepting chemotaxis protein [Rhizobium oryzicola]MDO1581418.1 methyl-accepting chemotaxis protein [Rhizobium oryzicola]